MQKLALHFFVGGVFLGAVLFNIAPGILPISLIISILLALISTIRQWKIGYLLTFSLLITSLVIWRGVLIFPEPTLTNFENERVTITGTVVGEPDIRETTTRLIIETTEKGGEKIIASVPHYPKFETGDVVEISGMIKLPENFENNNGISFDYINFLAKDRIYTLTYRPHIELLEKPSGFHMSRSIFRIKNAFLEKIQKIMPSPESELLGGVLLGTKRSLGADLEENFRRVGLIHIVVLSGYNVTIIAEAIFRFFGFLPKIFATVLGVISILIFMVMVGSGATVVRATVMTLLALFARISGKTYSVNRALFLAGALMVFHNPAIVLHDPSFQLSFLATVGLINFADFVGKFMKFVPKKFELREISIATLSTQLSVLPLLMRMTGELSIVAPIVNIITLQVIPITMLLGFIAGLVAFISEKAGIFLGFLPYLLLKYILAIVDFFASFDFAVWVF